MGEKNNKFLDGSLGVGKKFAKVALKAKENVVNIMDQNGDGNFDIQDVNKVAGTVGEKAKEIHGNLNKYVEELKLEMERKSLRPIFREDFTEPNFALTNLIRVVKRDKKREDSVVCKGSVGHWTTYDDLDVVNIYKDELDYYGITLFPDTESEVYYIDPSDRDRYIAMQDYFGELKKVRINELQKIAQDLGAKHFKVTYRENKASLVNNKMKGGLNLKGPEKGDGKFEYELDSKESSSVEIAAEMECPGHDPIEPTLRYLKGEDSIRTLISLRMDKNSPITHQKYTLELKNSSGIKENTARKIDIALKGMKLAGNMSVASEVQNESRRYFEYEIWF